MQGNVKLRTNRKNIVRCKDEKCATERSSFFCTAFYYRQLNACLIFKVLNLWMSKVTPLHIAKILDIKCKTVIAILFLYKKGLVFI